MVAHHHNVCFDRKFHFELFQVRLVRTEQNVTRIKPHAVFHRRFGKGEVACSGEIVHPGKVKNFVCIPPGDLFCPVRGAGIDNDDLIGNPHNAI